MADGFVRVTPDSDGKRVDCDEVTVGGVTVERQRVTVVGTGLTANAPAAATVGTSSASAVASNANRRGLVLVNTSANIISLNLAGGTAVLYSGITLAPYGSFTMDPMTAVTGAITAIASVASSNLAIQEFQ